MRRKEKESNKKVVLGILLLLLALLLIFGTLFAYFSDVVITNAQATAGTLDISGTTQLYLNGDTTPLGSTTIANFNPGDILVVKGTISNSGNKSAWVREIVDFTGTDTAIESYIKVYSGDLDAEEIKTASVLTGATSEERIINGSGTAAETENAEDEAIGAATYNYEYTIYFDSAAPNTAQGKVVKMGIKTQAMQYRNNPTPTWANVVDTPFVYTAP